MRPKNRSERGFGLVELIIYAALSLTVLSAVGGVVISMVNVQNQVMNSANAAEQAQLISRSVGSGVRNSTAITLETVSSVDQILRVRTASSTATATWFCQAWYFSASERAVRFKSSSTAIQTPTGQDLAGWTLLGSGVTAAQGQQIFLLSGAKVSLAFAEQLGSEAPIVIRTSASGRGAVRISAPCF